MLRITRRMLLGSLAAGPALAEPRWSPPGPITLVVPFASGGATDALGQLIAGPMAAHLGQAVRVRNAAGEGGQAGTAEVARGAPDGLTLVIANVAVLAFHPHLFPRLLYDPLRDFAPVGVIGANPMVLLASQASGITSIARMRMRADEGRLSIGSAGRGSALYMAGRMLVRALGGGGELVTYAGGGPAMEDLQAGLLDVMADQAITAIPATHQGARALAVLGPQRLPEIATVPTAAELGLPLPDLAVWNVLAAPAGTPPHIIHALAEALEAALEDEMLAQRFATLSLVTPPRGERGPGAAATLIGVEHARWGRFIRQAGMEREG